MHFRCKCTGLDLRRPCALDDGWRLEAAMRKDPIEERLQDLERLVLKQAERIDELEEVIGAMQRQVRRSLLTQMRPAEKTEAA